MHTSTSTCTLFWVAIILCGIDRTYSLSHNIISASASLSPSRTLTGDWLGAKLALRNPDCCVVTVSGLDRHLQALQEEFVDNGPLDLDLRSRIRTTTSELASTDCGKIRNSVVPGEAKNDDCTAALEELARGVALLADGPLENECTDVHMRIVCASDYRAIDPMMHTDKCPLRGYVTLRGVGTEYMTRTCKPMEYMTLRSLGKRKDSQEPFQSLRKAQELEFIVMKGDYYPQEKVLQSQSQSTSTISSWLSKVWQRTFACVHRSPPGIDGGRRVIVSLDLADGDDDREWYQAGQKREWRSGMTQRKSRLVA